MGVFSLHWCFLCILVVCLTAASMLCSNVPIIRCNNPLFPPSASTKIRMHNRYLLKLSDAPLQKSPVCFAVFLLCKIGELVYQVYLKK